LSHLYHFSNCARIVDLGMEFVPSGDCCASKEVGFPFEFSRSMSFFHNQTCLRMLK